MTLYTKKYTIKEWNKLIKTVHDGSILGNDFQYYNHSTGRKESYDYITAAEIILSKYEVILTDYKTKKEKFNGIMDKLSFENLDKTMTKISKGIDSFAKAVEAPKEKKSRKSKRSNRKSKKDETDYSFLFSRKGKTKFF